MAKKDKKKKRLLNGYDIALAILTALGGSVLFITVALVVGSIMFPETWERSTADAPSAQPSYYGTLPSRAPAQPSTPDSVESITLNDTDTPEPAQTPSEAVLDTPSPTPSQAQIQEPAPSRTQTPATPAPTRTPATQNPGPVVSINPTAPPTKQTQAPVQAGNQGGGSGGFGTDRFERPNWGEKGNFLGSTDSNKYHRQNCANGAARIRPENERWFNTEEEAQAAGYERCGICW